MRHLILGCEGHALQLAAGDHRRLEVLADGTVVVHNRQAR